MLLWSALASGALALFFAGWHIFQRYRWNAQITAKDKAILELSIALARAEEALKAHSSAQSSAADLFYRVSGEALEKNAGQFLEKAHNILAPLKEYMGRFDENLRRIEMQRSGDRESLRKQMEALAESERLLRQETVNLAKALKAPNVRGRWGEIHLRRLVELAGMVRHCDFTEQGHSQTQEGAIRPDMVVHLPGGRHVIIDAKVPLEAYLAASQAMSDPEKEHQLKEHVRHLKAHITALGKKGYWKHLQPSPEFAVLFLPTEVILHAALDADPMLIEWSMEQGVILATPATLMGLLKAIAYGWKQESLSAHAEKISELGHELYKRINDMATHFGKVGKNLQSATEAYNKTIASLETRVLVTARKFKEFGAASDSMDIPQNDPIELQPRPFSSAEIES